MFKLKKLLAISKKNLNLEGEAGNSTCRTKEAAFYARGGEGVAWRRRERNGRAYGGGGSGGGGAAKGTQRRMSVRMRQGMGARSSKCSSTPATAAVYFSSSSAISATSIISLPSSSTQGNPKSAGLAKIAGCSSSSNVDQRRGFDRTIDTVPGEETKKNRYFLRLPSVILETSSVRPQVTGLASVNLTPTITCALIRKYLGPFIWPSKKERVRLGCLRTSK